MPVTPGFNHHSNENYAPVALYHLKWKMKYKVNSQHCLWSASLVPFCYSQSNNSTNGQISSINKQKCFIVECGGWTEEPHSLRKEAALQSGGTAADAPVLLARRQEGQRTAVGTDIVFKCPRLPSSISPMLSRWIPVKIWAVLTTCCRALLL